MKKELTAAELSQVVFALAAGVLAVCERAGWGWFIGASIVAGLRLPVTMVRNGRINATIDRQTKTLMIQCGDCGQYEDWRRTTPVFDVGENEFLFRCMKCKEGDQE